jgi:hypothetical protein
MTMIRNILIMTIIAALVPTAMSNVSASAASEIALFSSDSDSLSISGNGDNAKMILKAMNENGRTIKVAGFQLTADNVLSIDVGDKVSVKDKVDFTKAITTDSMNSQNAVGITNNGVIDFAVYPQGVYTLDVVVDDERAFEGIIVIGQQTQESVKSVSKEIIFEIYNGTGGSRNSTKGNDTSILEIRKQTNSGSGGSSNITENGNLAGSGGDAGSNMTQGITEFATMPEKPVDPCLEDPQSEECEQIRSQSCDALGCPGYPISEPEPELIECDEGEELVEGQCLLIPENPEEPIIYDELVTDEDEETNDEEEEIDEVPEEEEAEEESGGSEDEVENDDDEEGGGESEEESTDEEGSDDSGETSE